MQNICKTGPLESMSCELPHLQVPYFHGDDMLPEGVEGPCDKKWRVLLELISQTTESKQFLAQNEEKPRIAGGSDPGRGCC